MNARTNSTARPLMPVPPVAAKGGKKPAVPTAPKQQRQNPIPKKPVAAAPTSSENGKAEQAPRFASEIRTVPVQIERKFEDRVFVVDAANLPAELREFALAYVGMNPSKTGMNVEVKIEAVIQSPGDDDTFRATEFKGLKFTVTRPADEN